MGKTYLRHEYNAASPIICSNASTHMAVALLPSSNSSGSNLSQKPTRLGVEKSGAHHAKEDEEVAFVPGLESVSVWSLRSGKQLGTLSPAACDMANTTSQRMDSGSGQQNIRIRTATNEVTALHLVEPSTQSSLQSNEWQLMVGYANGFVAYFRGSAISPASSSVADSTGITGTIRWVCDVFALGHKPDTSVLSLTLFSNTHSTAPYGGAEKSSASYTMCSGGQDTDISFWDLTSQEPLYRLRGHRGGVTGLALMNHRTATSSSNPGVLSPIEESSVNSRTLLISSSADGMIKVWDLTVQQCIQTIVATDTQITSMKYLPTPMPMLSPSNDDDTCTMIQGRILVGLRENVIKVFAVSCSDTMVGEMSGIAADGNNGPRMVIDACKVLIEHGTISRKVNKAVTNLILSRDSKYLCAQSSDTLEFFLVSSEDEIKRKIAQRKRRKQKKVKKDDEKGQDTTEDVTNDDTLVSATGVNYRDFAKDELTHLRTFNFAYSNQATGGEGGDAHKRKLRSMAFGKVIPARIDGTGGGIHVVVTYNNNSIESFVCHEKDAEVITGAVATRTLSDLKTKHSVTTSGHRHDVRFVEFTDNDEAIITMSKDSVKLWYTSSTCAAAPSAGLYYGGQITMNGLRDRVLDEAYYNNVAPPSQTRLVCASSVAPEDITPTITSISVEGRTSHATTFTCCAVIASDVVAVGDETGGIHLINMKSGDMLFSDPHAHGTGNGCVKALVKLPDDSGFTSIGTDRRVVTWVLELQESEVVGSKEGNKQMKNNKGSNGGNARFGKKKGTEESNNDDEPTTTRTKRSIQLRESHEMELNEVPLFIRFSPKLVADHGEVIGKPLYAIGLQDNTIQLFYADTNKPFLSLYGHKLSPTDVAFSDDGQMVASVGIDKSLRFWGSDFGDCHRAIHAHDDYVTSVRFVPRTHYVFTCSLDGSMKHWDGDTWTMIQTFRCHQRGLHSLTINSIGSHIASVGVDKCLRIIVRTEEMLFPEEEESRIAQEAMDDENARRTALQKLDEKDVEVGVSGQTTAATASASESLMDAIDLVSVELQRLGDSSVDGSSRQSQLTTAMLRNRTVWEYLWATLESIRPSELRHSISHLTSVHLAALLQYLSQMDLHGAILNYEIAARILLSLVAPAPGSSSKPPLFFDSGSSMGGTGEDSSADARGILGAIKGKRRRIEAAAEAKRHEERRVSSLNQLEDLRNRIAVRLRGQLDRTEGNIAAIKFIMNRLEKKEKIQFFDVSKIQGRKKTYHSSRIEPAQ